MRILEDDIERNILAMRHRINGSGSTSVALPSPLDGRGRGELPVNFGIARSTRLLSRVRDNPASAVTRTRK